jgi:hypothetical protein
MLNYRSTVFLLTSTLNEASRLGGFVFEESRWCPLDRSLGAPQNWSERFEEEIHLPLT